jgi:DNA-binding MarR family transcriptional regulator
MTALEQLRELGFGQYEAQAYITLLKKNPLSGYELARDSGVPRANIYTVLQKLEERGAVVRLDTEGSRRYAPVLPEELIQGLRQRLQTSLEDAEKALCNLAAQLEPDYVWNTHGYPVVLDHARSLIDAASRELLLATNPQEAPALTESLDRAGARGVKITSLCTAGCQSECGACRGQVYRYHVAPQTGSRYLMVIPDQVEVLAGEIGPGESAQAVRTRQNLLVNLAIRHINDSIALSALLLDLGDRLDDLLTPETRSMLASFGSEGQGTGWLAEMRFLLQQPRPDQTQ